MSESGCKIEVNKDFKGGQEIVSFNLKLKPELEFPGLRDCHDWLGLKYHELRYSELDWLGLIFADGWALLDMVGWLNWLVLEFPEANSRKGRRML